MHRRLPDWFRLAVLCGVAYSAIGQLWLAMVYHRFPWLEHQEIYFHYDDQFKVVIAAVWLVSAVPALSSHPHSARWAAFSAGAGAAIGLGLHFLGRWLLWPQLEGGCQVHSLGQGLTDLFCADLVPGPWDDRDLAQFIFLWPTTCTAAAFLLAAVFVGVRRMTRSQTVTREGT